MARSDVFERVRTKQQQKPRTTKQQHESMSATHSYDENHHDRAEMLRKVTRDVDPVPGQSVGTVAALSVMNANEVTMAAIKP